MGKVTIPWEQIEALGGRVEGDPMPRVASPRVCDGGRCRQMISLPESGPLVLRVLWRARTDEPLLPMEVPLMMVGPDPSGSMNWLLTVARCDGRTTTSHLVIAGRFDEAQTREEALAAIVAAEAGKVTA